jgi:hypothetical protein
MRGEVRLRTRDGGRSGLAKRQDGPVSAGVVVDRPGDGREVTSGFTKAEILKPEVRPSGPTGVFTRVGGLLAELLG